MHAQGNPKTDETPPPDDHYPLLPAPLQPEPQLLAPLEPIPAEVAFEHIGYFTPTSRRLKSLTTKEKVIAERMNADGTRTTLTIRIIGTGSYGLPNTSDLDYYRAFLKLLDDLTDQTGQLPNPIRIATKTLLRYAGKQASAREFRAVTDWIRRSHYTGIQGFYYDAATGDYVEIGDEPLFPRYRIRGQRLDNGDLATTHHVWLASWFRANYLHHYLRPIDLAFHRRLRKPIAKALYPLLELGWYATGGKPYTKSYHDLCQDFLLHESPHLARIKQQLDPAHRDLAQERFLERWDYRPAATGQTWIITYHPGPKFFADQRARESRRQLATRIATEAPPFPPTPPSPSGDLPPLLADILAVCGDPQNQAAYQKVLRNYPEELLRMALAETRQAHQEGRIRKTCGAYFMDTLKRLAALRRTPPPDCPEAEAASPRPVVPASVQAVPPDAMQERRALETARQHTQTRVDAVLAALTPAQRQALEARATARVTLQATELGYGVMLQFAREDLVQQEHLGFDCWARLVAQVHAHDVTAAGDAVLQACQLEAIRDEVLVVSVPTAEAKVQFAARYLGTLADLASTPTHRTQIQVLVR
jgi:hypothetical protein